MSKGIARLNIDVTKFLDGLKHPLRKEIEQLRQIILKSVNGMTEDIKWNGPNYSFDGNDRITMRVQPPKQIQLIFHRGVKKLSQPKGNLIDDKSGLLNWRENDRAIVSFKGMAEIEKAKTALEGIVSKWIDATK